MPDLLRDYMRNWFLGFHVKQFFIEFVAWEKFFLSCGPLEHIVELGAGQGGFSFYLFLQAEKRRATFDAWDKYPVPMANSHIGKKFGFSDCCHTGNLLKDERVIEEIRESIGRPGRTVLFCDNGNKRAEVNLYVPHLNPGDYLALHDWGHEIFLRDIEGMPLKEYEIEVIDELGCWTRFFEVVDV